MNAQNATSSTENLALVFGAVIANLRRERALSGKQLGALLGVSQQQISRYEKGQCEIKIAMLCSILNHLNYSLDFFFGLVVKKLKENKLQIYNDYQSIFKFNNIARKKHTSSRFNSYYS